MYIVVTVLLVYMMHSSRSESEASSLFSKQTSANQLHKLYRTDAVLGIFCQKRETAWDQAIIIAQSPVNPWCP